MNAVILDGAPAGDMFTRRVSELAAERLAEQNCRVMHLPLATMNIRPCVGCFNCWLVTPGRCVFKDDEEQVLTGLANAETWVMVTPVTFGGYSSTLKPALDRVIPVLLPFFIKVDGVTHHPQRYPADRRLVMIGTLPRPNPESEKIFRDLVNRNAINMGQPVTTTLVAGTDDAGLRRGLRQELLFGEKQA